MAGARYLECGKIVNTHGVKGAVKVENRCDTPKVLSSLKRVFLHSAGVYTEKKVKNASVFKEFVIMELDGVSDMDAAMLLKNTLIYADREDIPLKNGAYFLADLEGLDVIDAEDGRIYGKLREVINRGASDIYVIDTPEGERMMPAVPEFVKRVDVESGIFVTPIPGMLDED
ncbi:MAG: 16S rRNA processing protein RimM [Ruminococcaceae bacterium]|nr:16S rRNA processing protein RimM [Oscillospiraceae bacterium]